MTAIADLLFDSFEVHKVLVIAPLRVARDTWSAELQKWDQLHHLTYSIAVGTEAERRAALTRKADIYIPAGTTPTLTDTKRQKPVTTLLQRIGKISWPGQKP